MSEHESIGIELNAPLVCLDVETTGDQPRVDRICQIAVMKMYPDGRVTEWQTLVNPTVPIPPNVSAIHGITDEAVKDAPTFEDIALKLAAALQKCDYLGYNLRSFDLQILSEEFKRVRARPEQILNGRVVDVFKLYLLQHRRTLGDAVRQYLGEEHTAAHDAMGDVRATVRVFAEMMRQHDNIPRTVEEIHCLLFETPREGHVDPDGKLIRRGKDVYLTFGKNTAGRNIREVDDGFLKWVLRGEFTPAVKNAIQDEIERRRLAGF